MDMDNKSYSEKLKHPKWQKKRLQIMKRDGFTCQEYGANDKELNVHHLKYIYDKDIWDYDNKNLITLCKNCHNERHELKNYLKDIIDKLPNVWLNELKLFFISMHNLMSSDLAMFTKIAERINLNNDNDII